MDISVYYFGTAGPFHPSKPLWLRQADIILEAPTRANLVDAIRAAATHVGVNAPIPENIVTLVWTGAQGEVGIVGGRPQPQPEPEEEEEQPAPARQTVTRRTPVNLRVPYGAPYTVQQLMVQPQPTGPGWLGASYVNGQNYVGQYFPGGGPSVIPTSGPPSAVYHHGRNYVGDWYGGGAWMGQGMVQPHAILGPPVLVQGVADVQAEMVHEAPAPEVTRPPKKKVVARPDPEPAEPARVEVRGEVSRERLTDMREDGLHRLEVTAGMGVLELHILVDVDGVEWGGAIPPVRAMQEPAVGGGSERGGGSEPAGDAEEAGSVVSRQSARESMAGRSSGPESRAGGEIRGNAGGSVAGNDVVQGV